MATDRSDRKKNRITATQFDIALAEEIAHARNMNVPTNSVSGAAAFVLMLRKRLYGPDCKLLDATNEAMSRLMRDAQAERAQYELEEQERRRQAQQAKPRVIVPGDPRFQN